MSEDTTAVITQEGGMSDCSSVGSHEEPQEVLPVHDGDRPVGTALPLNLNIDYIFVTRDMKRSTSLLTLHVVNALD